MFYPRHILPSLITHLSKKQVTVLTGMRRTGKTTLLQKLMEESEVTQKVFFDLERIDNRELFSENNYEVIVQVLKQRGIRMEDRVLIGIDEIQLVPNLPSVVKYLYDKYDIKFVLTGSSSYYLKNRFSESLAGRKKIFEIFPLSFHELLTFKEVSFVPTRDFTKTTFIKASYEQLKPFYEEYIQYGGFPEVVLAEDVNDKKDLLQDILSSYINLDLIALSDIRKSNEVYKLIKLLSSRIGARLDISKLSVISGINRKKVQNYIHLFEQSYLLATLPVFTVNPDREISKAKKLYFADNGIASLFDTPGSGALFENCVFNQIRQKGKLAYYALKSGKEIDFIVDNKIVLEVKESPTERQLKSIRYLANSRLGIDDVYLIGRYPASSKFSGFLWGGFIG